MGAVRVQVASACGGTRWLKDSGPGFTSPSSFVIRNQLMRGKGGAALLMQVFKK